jgi:hypothetical protein
MLETCPRTAGKNYELEYVSLLLSFGGGLKVLKLTLRADSDGMPGETIETIDFEFVDDKLEPVPRKMRFPSKIHPRLVGGKRYWLTATGDDSIL